MFYQRKHSRDAVYLFTFALLFSIFTPLDTYAEEPTGQQIVGSVEALLWGDTAQGRYAMTITTPHWQRTLEMRVWMDRPERTFIRILAPRKEKGIGSLRIKDEMWNYLPKVERTIKVPPSMMLQAWMGSDFTNDDLVKESNVINDYQHRITTTRVIDGAESYIIEAIPHKGAAVVWGKLVYYVRKKDLMPVKQEYYSERGELIKVLSFSEPQEMGGRHLPTRWRMQTMGKEGHETVIVVKEVEFDRPINNRVFSLSNLRISR
ncbi:MAG: outer membrane lipoprotein-sorting protein [Gammaproteobacteria bacterium]|nr:outer membrane lipoprotein-sorting protein [Gammaproteobacteria bacterium]